MPSSKQKSASTIIKEPALLNKKKKSLIKAIASLFFFNLASKSLKKSLTS